MIVANKPSVQTMAKNRQNIRGSSWWFN